MNCNSFLHIQNPKKQQKNVLLNCTGFIPAEDSVAGIGARGMRD